ncbi:hypothetical protein [Altererythrobacter lutimaris]|uniref:Uncharacterized protein n=1 Tax=Altererythrobacter lutimaris TaxID=2743979 RepID=A0A850HCH5_9SPHN|nr:hypothetical protein [Altererythrobacter lutimaris]NVE95459.1 hypothetical protein [Altererythrobacter lutimaris]
MLENSLFKNAQLSNSAASGFQGRALHAVGWNDLTARINAARDLRELLKQDLVLGAASFTDAAAGYFVPGEESERSINHNALGASKGLEDNELNIHSAAGVDLSDDSHNQGCREQ